ncbi:hypothetical protein [Anaplasma bovis]|uniref:hypothetical protein n=1 Tax=Anaplasma bovis TaxID=186733 RepID=UPI002FEE7892
MTIEMHPSQASGVLEDAEEKDSRAVTASLIDPQFLKKKEAECNRPFSVGDVFLAASYVSLLLELFASGYTLWGTSHPQSTLTLFKVTVAYYGLCLLMHAILVANSVVELRDLSAREREMTEKERRIKNSMEWLTVISAALWVVLCAVSVMMACNIHNAALQYSTLVLSLLSPFMCSIAGFLRVYDTYLSYRKERNVLSALEDSGKQTVALAQKAAAGRRAQSYFIRASLYGVISVFEAVHFLIHIWEAYILVGNTHKFFYITERAFLVSQVVLGTVFIALAIAERVLEHATEPDLAEDQAVSLGDQQLSVGAGASSYASDTAPLLSHEEGPAIEEVSSVIAVSEVASPVEDRTLAAAGL